MWLVIFSITFSLEVRFMQSFGCLWHYIDATGGKNLHLVLFKWKYFYILSVTFVYVLCGITALKSLIISLAKARNYRYLKHEHRTVWAIWAIREPRIAVIFYRTSVQNSFFRLQLDELLATISACLRERFSGACDTEFLGQVAPLFEACLLHARKSVRRQALGLWNATFGQSATLTYPESLRWGADVSAASSHWPTKTRGTIGRSSSGMLPSGENE